MKTSELKIAVIGAGLIGRTHIDRVAEHAVLHSIVDPVASAADIASQQGVPWFRGLTDALASDPPDGVIVASPNRLHLEHGEACIDAGIPVLIEKPLADGREAAERLTRLSAMAGTPVLVGHHRRHSPIIHAAKRVIEDGELGRLAAINAMFWLNKPADYFDTAWRKEPGGGPTYINLIHDIDLLQYLCGPISSVQAVEANGVRGLPVEDTSAILLSFANGALGTVTVSDTVSSPWSWEMTAGENPVYPKTDQSCYTIGGTLASLSLPDLRIWSHEGAQSWWHPMTTTVVDVTPLDPVTQQLLHFLHVISGQAPPLVTAADGLRNIRVLDAIKDAAKSGRTVEVGTD